MELAQGSRGQTVLQFPDWTCGRAGREERWMPVEEYEEVGWTGLGLDWVQETGMGGGCWEAGHRT